MKAMNEALEQIKQLLPLYQPVVFQEKQYVVLDIQLHKPIDRLLQVALISVRLGNLVDNLSQQYTFAHFSVNVHNMEIVCVELKDFPGRFPSADLEERIKISLK